MRFLQLFLIYLRIGLLYELQYRANFWIQLGKSGLNLVVALAGVAVIYGHTEDLNGWEPAELVCLLGIFVLMTGVLGVVVRPSMEKLIEDVRDGNLDFTLTKPEEAQVLVSISQVRVWQMIDVFLGPAVSIAALTWLGRGVSLPQAAIFALTLVAGTAILYSFWLILATISFWFIRIENIFMIFHSLYDAARWPVTIYPGWLQAALTFLVPVTFAVTVPAEALVGRLRPEYLALTIGLALVLLVVSRLFWRVGVRHYAGASA
jgi:ABC-2 type transport system permease protein